jgi:hypothetical protein
MKTIPNKKKEARYDTRDDREYDAGRGGHEKN